ncbi:MAG TPA: outer membrane beta-barrel protein [Blastocatellia bacterium]|nr:outer membrane beta-barrel protein [Blastocatellia bacterium]
MKATKSYNSSPLPKWESLKMSLRVSLRVALLTLSILWLGSVSPARAQDIQIGLDFATVVPRGGFSENVTNNGYGVGGRFLVGLGRSPFHLGVDAAFTNYGSEEHEEPLSTTIPEIDVKVRTDNNIILTHLLLRAQPRSGRVRPYADGLIGLKYLFTRTSISNEFDEEIASTTNLSDTTFSYGFGGGLQVHLANIGPTGDISFDTKVRYLRGSQAEYLKKGSIRRENGSVSFDVLSSRTDVVTVQVGVTFRF